MQKIPAWIRGNKKEKEPSGVSRRIPVCMIPLSLCHCIDLAGKTGLFAACGILVIHMICGSLVDRLASGCEEGLCFLGVACLNGVKDAAGSRTHTGLLSGILGMALRIGFHAQNRRLDIRQNFHLPQQCYQVILARRKGKSNLYFASSHRQIHAKDLKIVRKRAIVDTQGAVGV